MSIETKKLFGVTMNPKMGSRKMTRIWFGDGKKNEGVTQEVRDAYPDLDAKMEECRVVNETLDLKTKIKETKKAIQDATTAAVNAAAAIVAGLVQLPIDIATALAALLDMNISIGIAAGCKKQLHREIDKIIPEYLPDEENLPDDDGDDA